MIHEVGNIELCELLDTEPKAQCKVCLSYWDVGIVYCTCGHFLRNGTEENKKFVQTGIHLGIHDRFIRDEKFCKNMFDMGRTEEMCRKMDELSKEDHTHHLTPEEIRGCRAKWWIRSNKVGPDTMPVRHHQPDFKQALSTLRQLKDQEDAAHQQRWTQSYSSSWWNWQESWWHSSYEHHHEDVPSTD